MALAGLNAQNLMQRGIATKKLMSEYTIPMEQKSTSTEGVANLLWNYKLSQMLKNRFLLIILGLILANLFYLTLLSVIIIIILIIYIFGAKIYLIAKYKKVRGATIYQYLDGQVYLMLNDLGFGFGKKQPISPKYLWENFSKYKIFRNPGILILRNYKFKTTLILYKKDMKSTDFEVLMTFVQHNVKEGTII
jgi:hypothetical protein